MRTTLDLGVLVVTLLLMVTAGVELAPADFRDVWRRKGLLLWALALPSLALPLLGLGVAKALGLSPTLTVGLLLLAAAPVGDSINVFTLLARGNLALAVTVNVLSCLLSMVTMSAAFALYTAVLGRDLALAVPTAALELRLVFLIVLPIVAGMAVRHWRPQLVAILRPRLHWLCLIGIILLLAYVLVVRWDQVVDGWRQTALASVVFLVAGTAVGTGFARLLRVGVEDRITIGFSCGARNVALATAIAVTLLNRIEFAEIAVVYFLVEVPLLLALALVYRRRLAIPAGASARQPS